MCDSKRGITLLRVLSRKEPRLTLPISQEILSMHLSLSRTLRAKLVIFPLKSPRLSPLVKVREVAGTVMTGTGKKRNNNGRRSSAGKRMARSGMAALANPRIPRPFNPLSPRRPAIPRPPRPPPNPPKPESSYPENEF